VTGPFDVPDAPVEIVSHVAFDRAVHVQPAGAVTFTVPPLAVPAIVGVNGVAAYVHAGENMNVFDTALVLVPPGPTALTRDSYTTPDEGSDICDPPGSVALWNVQPLPV